MAFVSSAFASVSATLELALEGGGRGRGVEQLEAPNAAGWNPVPVGHLTSHPQDVTGVCVCVCVCVQAGKSVHVINENESEPTANEHRPKSELMGAVFK